MRMLEGIVIKYASNEEEAKDIIYYDIHDFKFEYEERFPRMKEVDQGNYFVKQHFLMHFETYIQDNGNYERRF